jgi:hypothetical protein
VRLTHHYSGWWRARRPALPRFPVVEKQFFAILNEVNDLEPIDMTGFFASLRMTMGRIQQFFNSP